MIAVNRLLYFFVGAFVSAGFTWRAYVIASSFWMRLALVVAYFSAGAALTGSTVVFGLDVFHGTPHLLKSYSRVLTPLFAALGCLINALGSWVITRELLWRRRASPAAAQHDVLGEIGRVALMSSAVLAIAGIGSTASALFTSELARATNDLLCNIYSPLAVLCALAALNQREQIRRKFGEQPDQPAALAAQQRALLARQRLYNHPENQTPPPRGDYDKEKGVGLGDHDDAGLHSIAHAFPDHGFLSVPAADDPSLWRADSSMVISVHQVTQIQTRSEVSVGRPAFNRRGSSRVSIISAAFTADNSLMSDKPSSMSGPAGPVTTVNFPRPRTPPNFTKQSWSQLRPEERTRMATFGGVDIETLREVGSGEEIDVDTFDLSALQNAKAAPIRPSPRIPERAQTGLGLDGTTLVKEDP